MILSVAQQNMVVAGPPERESKAVNTEFRLLTAGVWLDDHNEWFPLNGKVAYPGRDNPRAEGLLARIDTEDAVYGKLRVLNLEPNYKLRLVVEGQIMSDDLGREEINGLGREMVVDSLLPGDEIAIVEEMGFIDDREVLKEVTMIRIVNDRYNPVITESKDDPDDIAYHILSWGDAGALADEIVGRVKRSGKRYDGLIVFLEGGRFLGKIVADALGFSEEKIFEYGSRRYDDIDVGGEVEVYEKPEIPPGNYLVIDDVIDSGKTVVRARIEYPDIEFDVAAMGKKPNELGVEAEYVGRRVEGVWIVYPWEYGELLALKLFKSDKWAKFTLEEAMAKFLEIGFLVDVLREAVSNPQLLKAGMKKARIPKKDRRDPFELSRDLQFALTRAEAERSRVRQDVGLRID